MRRVGAYFSQKLRELVEKFDIAVEVRGVGAIQALQLTVPGKPILEGAHANGLLINVTQDTVLRFLPPFLLEEKHVDRGVRILRKQLAAAQKEHKKAVKSAAAVVAVYVRWISGTSGAANELWHAVRLLILLARQSLWLRLNWRRRLCLVVS